MKRAIWFMIIIGGVLPLGGSAVFRFVFPALIWNHEPFHAVIEVVGTFAALTLATLLYLRIDRDDKASSYLFVVCALAGMGMLDGFHACTKPGVAFIWLHSAASLTGGFLFALVWLPSNLISVKVRRLLPFGTGTAAAILGIFSIAVPDSLPAMVHEGAFTPVAVGINFFGGVMFLIAASRFVVQYRANGNKGDIMFTGLCLLFSAGALLFPLSSLWDTDWWWWHLVRLGAYIIALYYTFALYRQTRRDLKETNRLLELRNTELKRAEKQLKEYSGRLEEMVEERTKELREAQEEMLRKERLAVLGHFSGSISHELRNPLGVIDSSVYYLKMKLGGSEKKVEQHLERIKASVTSATAIVQSLLNLTRMKKPDAEQHDLIVLVSESLGSSKIPDTVAVERHFPDTKIPVKVEREQIRMALKNIIKNGVEAMEGTGTLSVTIRKTENGPAELIFQDTGQGIQPEHLEKIFQPLFSTRAQGIGFGLSITKMIIENHGGTIAAQSEPGKGAAFVITLPLVVKGDQKNE